MPAATPLSVADLLPQWMLFAVWTVSTLYVAAADGRPRFHIHTFAGLRRAVWAAILATAGLMLVRPTPHGAAIVPIAALHFGAWKFSWEMKMVYRRLRIFTVRAIRRIRRSRTWLITAWTINFSGIIVVTLLVATEQGRELLKLYGLGGPMGEGSKWQHWQSMVQLVIALSAGVGALVGLWGRTINEEVQTVHSIRAVLKDIRARHRARLEEHPPHEEEAERIQSGILRRNFATSRFDWKLDIRLTYISTFIVAAINVLVLRHASLYPEKPVTEAEHWAIMLSWLPFLMALGVAFVAELRSSTTGKTMRELLGRAEALRDQLDRMP